MSQPSHPLWRDVVVGIVPIMDILDRPPQLVRCQRVIRLVKLVAVQIEAAKEFLSKRQGEGTVGVVDACDEVGAVRLRHGLSVPIQITVYA